MKWSLYIGKISGIKLFLHWTFLAFVLWIGIENLRGAGGFNQALYTVLFVLAVFVCITLHELGHALTAKKFGFKTRNITLLPIGGMAQMEEIPENPRQELLVAIAGPLVNFVIAAVLWFFVFRGVDLHEIIISRVHTTQGFLFNLFVVNLSLAVFNLIPAFPMDGGRIFRALVAMITKNRVRATNIAAGLGKALAVAFFIVGLFQSPMLAIIGVFIFISAHAENENVKSKFLLHDYTAGDAAMKKFFSLDVNDTINDATKLLLDVQTTDFLITDNGKIAGTLSRDEIISALSFKGPQTVIREVMNPDLKILEADTKLDEVYRQILISKNPLLPVMDHGKFIGIVDLNNILELIMVKNARAKNNPQFF
jgi:Zn-dependent protease